jgi:predicted PhzF superfamily epimerase YddE/YHI9
MAHLLVVAVFAGDGDRGGNPLGVFLDGGAVPPDRRQAVAAGLGYSETVFVDDAARGELRIFTPVSELPFAGHPLVGTAWALARDGRPVAVLRPPAGDVPTWADGEVVWIRARPEWSPDFAFHQHGRAADVDALDPAAAGPGMHFHWAWIDEAAGSVRARMFAPTQGITEDEATGSAATALVGRIGRDVTIHQGAGSVLVARQGPDGTVEVGGRCRFLDEGDYELS